MDDLEKLHQLLLLEQNYQQNSRDELWYSGNLRFLLHEAQCLIYDAFYSCNDRETVILASRRFGKSFLSVILCLEYAIRNANVITRFVPQEIKQAWQIVQPSFMKLEQLWPAGLVRYVASEKAWRIGRGSWLYLGGFDSQKDSQRGGEASFIVCDEAGFTNPDEYNYIMRSVLKPQLLTTKGRMLIPSTPSYIPDHPFMSQTVADAQLENRLHKFTIYDNPLLDTEQIEQAKSDCGGEASEAWRVEYLCEVIRSKNIVVVPCWDDKIHVDEWEPRDYNYRCLVGDFGGVTDKTVLHVVAYDYFTPTFGRTHFIDERVYEPNTTTNEITKGLKDLYERWIKPSKAIDQDHTSYLDCPGQLQVDLNKYHGIQIRIPLKDNFHAGVNLLNVDINNDRIRVHKRCKFTAQSFHAARFNEKRTDYIRTPVLGHCDAIASAIYALRHIVKSHTGQADRKPDKQETAYWKQPAMPAREFIAQAMFRRS
jgi:hypothetical protein